MPILSDHHIDLATRLFSKMGVKVEYIVQEGMLSIDNLTCSIGCEEGQVKSITGNRQIPCFVLYDGEGEVVARDTVFSVLLVRAAGDYITHIAKNFVDSEPHEVKE